MHEFVQINKSPALVPVSTLNPGEFFLGFNSGNLHIVFEKDGDFTNAFNLVERCIVPFNAEVGYKVDVKAQLQQKPTEEVEFNSFVIPGVETRHPRQGDIFVHDDEVYLMVCKHHPNDNRIFDLKTNKVYQTIIDLSKSLILSAKFNYEVNRA